MAAAPQRLLLIEDNPGDARLVEVALAEHAPGEFAVTRAERLADALARIRTGRFDAALCDLGLPDSTGIATAHAITAAFPALPVVVLTGSHNVDIGRAAIQHGAQDYLVKGESSGALIARTLHYAIERKSLELGLRAANEALESRVAERTAELERRTELYNMLSQTNLAIVRASGRGELFEAVCRIAVNCGRFRFATVALVDPDRAGLRLAAVFGEDMGYANEVRVSMDESDPLGRGAAGRALRTGEHVVSNDFLGDAALAPWHDAARRAKVRSMAAFPIREAGQVSGVLCLYSGDPGYFTGDMLPTLREIAFDVSFALDNLEREARRRRAEEALRRSEARYRSLFENMLNGYAYCRMLYDDQERPVDFVYLEVNASFGRLTGLNDVAGKRVSEIIPGIRQESPELFEIYGRVAASGVPEAFEIFIAPLKHWFSISVYGPEKGHFVAVFDVITDRKNADEALRAAEEQFRGLVEQSIAGIYIIQDGKFAYVNPRFAEIFGYALPEELNGCDPLSLVAAEDRAVVAENIRRRVEGEVKSVDYGFTGLRKDGSRIDVGVHGARATHAGRPAVIGLIQDISEKKRAEERIRRYVEQLKDAFMRTVEVATSISEMRDPYTAGHERRVAEIAAAIGTELGFDAHRLEGLRVGGYLHDIGKMTIPSEILSKPGKISAVEFALIKGHAQAGCDVLNNVGFPWPVAQMARQHHERADGSGYPQGLKGEEILLEARIIAVADVLEAMSSHRPYRPALGIDKALAEIERGRGTAYDPVVADACLKLFREKSYAIPA